MYEFTLDTDVDDMEEDDLRETFSDFLDAHEENVTEYEELREQVSEFDEIDLEDLQSRAAKVERVKQEFAEKAGEYTNLGTEYAVENFSLEKNIELAAKYEELQEEESAEGATEFKEREQRGKVTDEETTTKFDDEIEASLERIFS